MRDDVSSHTSDFVPGGEVFVDGVYGLWHRKWRIVWIAVVCAVLAFAASFLVTPRYTAKVTILPDSGRPDLAVFEQFAFLSAVGVTKDTNIENLYGRILLSDELLDGIIQGPWRWSGGTQAALFDMFGICGEDCVPTRRQQEDLKNELRSGAVDFAQESGTGLMVLRVTVPRDPELAADLANELTRRLTDFNVRLKLNKSEDTRRFIGERLAQADSVLDAAEGALTDFIENNRSYLESPELMQRFRELNRVVEAESVVWGELKRQYEIARIEQHLSLVRIDLLDEAQPPLNPSSPRRGLIAVLAFFVGGAMTAFVLIWRTTRRRGLLHAASAEPPSTGGTRA